MQAKITAILTDERGWQKPFPLNEGVFWVGSADKVHIQLPAGLDISPYHLQVVNAHNSPYVRVINLSKGEIVVQKGAESVLFAPDGFLDIFGPEIIRLGSFTLHFRLEKQNESQPAVVEGKQNLIGLRLVLPDMVLRPNLPLVGVLSLQNLGAQACQFRVDIDGLPPECCEISPPPLIFAGGEENTEIRFFHKLFTPPAGKLTVTIRVSAPEVYRDANAVVQQELKVIPYYKQSLSFERLEAEIPPIPVVPRLPFRQGFEPVLPVLVDPEFQPEKQPEQPVLVKDNLPPSGDYNTPQSGDFRTPQSGDFRTPQSGDFRTPQSGDFRGSNPPREIEPPAIPILDQPAQDISHAAPVAAAASETAPEPVIPEPSFDQPVPQDEPAIVNAPTRRQKRPDLTAVKVMKASSGDYLGKKGGQE